MRFPIRFDGFYRLVSRASFIPPSRCSVAVEGPELVVQMAWAFRARLPRASVAAVQPSDAHPLSRGVHGWNGRWLVNGSGEGLVEIRFQPAQQACVLGFPVRLETLVVSVEDPLRLAAALR